MVSYKNKQWLQHQYVDLRKTQREIAKECNCSAMNINWFIKKFNISTTKNQKKGVDSPNWKGDDASYKQLHSWLNKHKSKPQKCENCMKENKLELSFDHSLEKYTRNINDYKWLCRSCHMKRDYKLGVK